MRVHVNTRKVIKRTWKNSVHGVNFEIIAITEIYKMIVSVYFVTEGKIARTTTAILGQVVTKKCIYFFRY
jgi:hypothetical protein